MELSWIIERLEKDWAVISQAPISFLAFLLVVAVAVWFVVYKYNALSLSYARQQRDIYKEQAEAARSTSKASVQSVASRVEITSIKDEDSVVFRQSIVGTVEPKVDPVQVFVHAADNRWYAQGIPEFFGNECSITCQFGVKGRPGGTYRVVAIAGAPGKGGEPLLGLPNEGFRSREVIVHRRND